MGEQKMGDRNLRVGIIGAGGIARGAHVPGYRQSGRAEVTAVCDVHADAARAFAAAHGLSRHYDSVEGMLAQEDLDVVSICTSNDAHHPAAMAAIARGLHVFCEKPLAMNFAQALEMYEASRSQGVVTGINFTYRTTPAARYIKELTEEAIFGDVKHFSIEYYQSYSVQPGRKLGVAVSERSLRARAPWQIWAPTRPTSRCGWPAALPVSAATWRPSSMNDRCWTGPAWAPWTWTMSTTFLTDV